MTATIFKNIFSKEPHFITIEKALERIKLGASKGLVMDIRLGRTPAVGSNHDRRIFKEKRDTACIQIYWRQRGTTG